MNKRLSYVKKLSKNVNFYEKKQFFSKVKEIILRSRLMVLTSPVAELDA